ncbi:MAG: ABC transporter ATP-binding protein [Crenarchaeota archaeon]|nr:ABC transporter ATP-binding protein [Thermoproteota archaeon]
MDYAIEAENLIKIYSKSKKALDGVNLKIPKGRIFCLIGRNGAGKTTFLRIVGTQLEPTSGRAVVLGHDVVREPDEIRPRISVVPQEAKVWNFLTPWDYVYYYARLRGMSAREARETCIEALKKLDLYADRNRLCLQLSGGMKQRVLVSMAIVSGAELLLLDEPSIGLDPVSRRQLWSYIRRIAKAGHTIVLTTHYMDEAEALADDIAIIHEGRILVNGDIDQILGENNSSMILEVNGDDVSWTSEYGCEEVIGGKAKIRLGEDERIILEIMAKAREKRCRVTFRRPTLEDVFIRLVGGVDLEPS